MKSKFLVSLLLIGGSMTCFAQGYKDGIEYYKVAQYDNAKELLERNLNNPSTDKSATLYYLGSVELVHNNKAQAQELFNKGVAANAEYPYNYVGLGAVNLKNGDEKAAESNFELAKKKGEKKDAKIVVGIARAYYMADPVKYKEKIDKLVKQAQKMDARNPEVCVLLGDMEAANKNYGEAAGWFDMAKSFDSDLTEAYVKYANTYFFVNPKEAINTLEALVQANPNSALAQRELAEKYYEDDQWTKAAEKYGEYIKNPNHFKQDEVRYASLLFFGKKYQESYDLAVKIIASLQANDKNVFYMDRLKVYNLVAMEKWAEAEEAAKVFFAQPIPAGAKYEVKDFTDYADALKAQGKSKEALTEYVKAYDMNQDKVDLLKDISSSYNEAEDYVNAAKYYQLYVDKADYKTNDLFVLSKRYSNIAATATDAKVKADAVAQSLKYVDIVNEKVPNDTRILSQKARIERITETNPKEGKAMGTYKAILSLLDAKENAKTENADLYQEIYQYMANYYFSVGDKAEMKAYYKKWLEVDPSNNDLRKYVESLK